MMEMPDPMTSAPHANLRALCADPPVIHRRETRGDDGRKQRKQGGQHVVAQHDGQREGQHADEMHRPDADAHRDRAADQPGVDITRARRRNPRGERERRIGDEHRDRDG